MSYLLTSPVGDGGQWDMLCSLIEKYGVVPKTAYPESKSSSASREMDATLTEKLREDACILRKLHREGQTLDALRTRKAEMLNEVYRLLCICLGEPPKTFTFEYRDADDHFHRETGLTPKRFFEKYVGVDLSDYVSLINAPTADKPYGRSKSSVKQKYITDKKYRHARNSAWRYFCLYYNFLYPAGSSALARRSIR